MSGLYDDEVVTAEGPKNCTKSCHPNAEVESPEHDVEAEQHHEDVGGIGRETWQAELIDLFHHAKCLRAAIAGTHLISGHSAEERIGPTRSLTIMSRSVLVHLHTTADASGVVVSRQDQPIADGHDEIHDADGHKEQDGQHIRKKLFQIHNS